MIIIFAVIFLLIFGGILGFSKYTVPQNKIMGASLLGLALYALISLISSPIGFVSLAVLSISAVLFLVSIFTLLASKK